MSFSHHNSSRLPTDSEVLRRRKRLIVVSIIVSAVNSIFENAHAIAQPPSLPVYIVDLASDGTFLHPHQVEELAKKLREANPTDVFVLVHGWNTSRRAAVRSYNRIVDVMSEVADRHKLKPTDSQPFVIGLYWPSLAWNDETDKADGPVDLTMTICAALPAERSNGTYLEDVLRVRELLDKAPEESTTSDEAELLKILGKYALPAELPEDRSVFEAPATPERYEVWREAAEISSPKDLFRIFTFWQMKKRAGVVGERGGAALLHRLLESAPQSRVHLAGHSFGAKVCLAALSSRPLPQPVTSLTLLQPAISAFAFAERVPGTNLPGGYRSVLLSMRVRGPVLVTFSKHDWPLNKAYPWGSLVAGQTGELEHVLARYAALGAVGAQDAQPNAKSIAMLAEGIPYSLAPALWNVDATQYILGHSAFDNSAVAWLLWSAASAEAAAADSAPADMLQLRRTQSRSTLRPKPHLTAENNGGFPDFDPRHSPPSGTHPLFRLSQDYPSSYDTEEHFPWQSIDFRAHPQAYLRAVLDYCLAGNIEVDFRVQDNPIRKWYHAPWLHDDGEANGAGREYHHGLTRERRSRPFELHPRQGEFAQNWAVGMVNDRGGYTLGRVWRIPDGYPDPTNATFPDNTVSFKLLFTDASDEQVPFLRNSKSWMANIYKDTNYQPPRIDRQVRLLQIDVAIKEPRVAQETGWIFGTFIYDAEAPFKSVWERMTFVGLSWGDDAQVKTHLNRNGAFENGELASSIINTSLIETPGRPEAQAQLRHFGLGGRVNGPVDSPVSSCISCHARAGNYAASLPLSETSGKPLEFVISSVRSPSDFPLASFDRFFRTIRPNAQLVSDAGEVFVTTDYSLQVSAGIRNYYQSLRTNAAAVNTLRAEGLSELAPESLTEIPPLPRVTRGEEN